MNAISDRSQNFFLRLRPFYRCTTRPNQPTLSLGTFEVEGVSAADADSDLIQSKNKKVATESDSSVKVVFETVFTLLKFIQERLFIF